MALRPLTDKDIRDVLLEVVSRGINVTTWEGEFLEDTLYSPYKRCGEWSVKQRARAAKIAEKYRHQL